MPTSQPLIYRFLNRLERFGNRLPHPTLLFVYLAGLMLLLSAVASLLGLSSTHPLTGESIRAVNLLSTDGLHQILTSTVSNFTQFAPVGTVLVAMLGIGVAEQSGLFDVLLRSVVRRAHGMKLTLVVVFVGVMSSLAADSGYVILIPLAAIVFKIAGRHPLAGIAAAFAGVSGGYSANLLLGPFDAILSGISTEAAHIVDPDYQVSVAANYYFMIASTLLITLVGAWVTRQWVEPRLSFSDLDDTDKSIESDTDTVTPNDARAIKMVGVFSVLFVGLLFAGLFPTEGVLRSTSGEILSSPFIKGIVVIISVYALLCGLIFARASGRWQSLSELINAMESSMASMAGYLVLMFFAAQFVAYFSWSQLGIISAIEGAQLLKSWDLPSEVLLLAFIVVAALINLLIGSGSAKWALLAPIFVPMLMLSGISPEA
ncbi:MAG: SLC13 family permease, partial [Oleibacter sp.]|nr:SLC13 family permease [Thalassolituus sp.]